MFLGGPIRRASDSWTCVHCQWKYAQWWTTPAVFNAARSPAVYCCFWSSLRNGLCTRILYFSYCTRGTGAPKTICEKGFTRGVSDCEGDLAGSRRRRVQNNANTVVRVDLFSFSFFSSLLCPPFRADGKSISWERAAALFGVHPRARLSRMWFALNLRRTLPACHY